MRIPTATPYGMTRRHFLTHLAGASAMAGTAISFTNALAANSEDLRKRHKAAIMLWMGGGPSTMDIWDLKPGAATGGPFKPISTSAPGVQICEHMPMTAKVMHNLAIIRSMSTREADHQRGRYYMHTGYVPNPNIEHPGYGSVISHELASQVPDLEIPPFVSVGGGSVGPGFLGMTYAPFVVGSNGDVRNLNMGIDQARLMQRMTMLASLEKDFIAQKRGESAEEHAKVLEKTVNLMTSKQMAAFKIDSEPDKVKERYGVGGQMAGGMRRGGAFGRGLLMARRLVESGVSFVEVDLGGWDNHANIHNILKDQKLPELDQAMSALVEDLEQRGMLEDTAIIWMGEFSRTPRINGNAGRDHWARAMFALMAGGGVRGGRVIGATDDKAAEPKGTGYTPDDVAASFYHNIGIEPGTEYHTDTGRPVALVRDGKVIPGLFGE